MGLLCGLFVEAWLRAKARIGTAEKAAAARWSSISLPVMLILVSLFAWMIHVIRIEPERSRQRSMAGVAAKFAPHLAGDERLYLDTWDAHAALFVHLERAASLWRLDDPLPDESITAGPVERPVPPFPSEKDLERAMRVFTESDDGEAAVVMAVDISSLRHVKLFAAAQEQAVARCRDTLSRMDVGAVEHFLSSMLSKLEHSRDRYRLSELRDALAGSR